LKQWEDPARIPVVLRCQGRHEESFLVLETRAESQHAPISFSQSKDDSRLPCGRDHFRRNYFWKCRPFADIYLLSVFMSLKTTSRSFTKGVLLYVCRPVPPS